MKPGARHVAEIVCRLGLGSLFIYSSLSKMDDPGLFADMVMRFEMLPEFAVGIFSLSLPMMELLAGLMFIFTKWLREAALLSSGMLAMFMIALSSAILRGLEIDCGCFGFSEDGGRRELLIAIVRDVALLVPSLWLVCRPEGWLLSRR